MPELYPATVRIVEPSAENQVFMLVDVPKEVWSQHIQPSQHVDIVLPGMEPWTGTIANRPGYEFFEFLVKDKGGRSSRIASLQPGDELEISLPKGPGFPLLAYRRHDIIMGATGVAVCAMRAVIMEMMLARSDWGRALLFYGERTADRFAFINERDTWTEYEIEIRLSASNPSDGTYYRGHTGYIQEHFAQDPPDLGKTVVFLAGKDGMVTQFTDVLIRLGLNPNMIFLNL